MPRRPADRASAMRASACSNWVRSRNGVGGRGRRLDHRQPGGRERFRQHEIVEMAEVLHVQAIGQQRGGITRAAGGANGGMGAVLQFTRQVGIGRHRLAQREGETHLERGAWIGADAAERREIGDEGVGRAHEREIGGEDGAARCPRRHIQQRVAVQRIKSGKAEAGAQLNLAPADFARVVEEHFGAGEVQLHQACPSP